MSKLMSGKDNKREFKVIITDLTSGEVTEKNSCFGEGAIKVKCSICGQDAYRDEYGNGECKNCGWKFSKDEEKFEKDRGISYPMLVSPTTARRQYLNGEPFKATFNEFVNGLYFYSEMLFTVYGVTYEVYLESSRNIVMCNDDTEQKFSSREEFINNASIDGKLLKDIWVDVSFAGFMYCG